MGPGQGHSHQKKHGIDFADAVAILEDPMALTIEDPNISEESRWMTLGMDFFARLWWWFTLTGETPYA